MALTWYPNEDGERATCITAVARIAKRPGLGRVLTAVIAEEFDPAAVTYEQARVDNDGAGLAAAKAMDDKNGADAAFAEAFNAWIHSAYGKGGEASVRKAIKPLLGNVSPAQFLSLKPRTRIERMARVDVYVRGKAHLQGDLALLDALRDATGVFEVAVELWELALEDRSVTVKARRTATVAFDKAYRYLVRSIRKVDPEGAGSVLPQFVRLPKADAAAAATPGEPEVDQEPAVEEPAVEEPAADDPQPE